MLLPWPETSVTFLRLLGVHSLNKMHFNTGYQKLLGESEMEQRRKECVYLDKALKYGMKPPSPIRLQQALSTHRAPGTVPITVSVTTAHQYYYSEPSEDLVTILQECAYGFTCRTSSKRTATQGRRSWKHPHFTEASVFTAGGGRGTRADNTNSYLRVTTLRWVRR